MKLVVIGVNHKTAPVALRERLAFGDDLMTALASFKAYDVGAVIVSTCNRSEIYACFDDEGLAHVLYAKQVASPSATDVHSDHQTTAYQVTDHQATEYQATTHFPSGEVGAGTQDMQDQDRLLDGVKSFDELDLAVITPAELANLDSDHGTHGGMCVHGAWLQHWLAEFKGMTVTDIEPYLYVYHDERALNHWLRVASGLDSMILGEPQILGQIRQAVALSHSGQALGANLGWLTQQIFAAAKAVRRDTSLGKQAVSLGYATAKLVTQIYDDPSRLTLLVVAAGEMNRLVAQNVASLGVNRVIIANRSPERAQILSDELAEQAAYDGRVMSIETVGLDMLHQVLMTADVVSSCSGSMHTLIDVAMVKSAMKARRYRPMLMVDLAVPRDIDSHVGKLDNVYLYSIDDLEHVIAGNVAARRQAAVEAELMVSQLASHIESQIGLMSASKHIHDYRSRAKYKSDVLLSRAKAKLAQGVDPSLVLDELAHTMLQTLSHPPSRLIRHIATTKDTDTLNHVVQGLKSYRED